MVFPLSVALIRAERRGVLSRKTKAAEPVWHGSDSATYIL